jgi:hypothetical protein
MGLLGYDNGVAFILATGIASKHFDSLQMDRAACRPLRMLR